MHVHCLLNGLQVDNKSSTQVTLVEIKLHQRLHLMGESFLGQINKHIDVVRVASRYRLRLMCTYCWICVVA